MSASVLTACASTPPTGATPLYGPSDYVAGCDSTGKWYVFVISSNGLYYSAYVLTKPGDAPASSPYNNPFDVYTWYHSHRLDFTQVSDATFSFHGKTVVIAGGQTNAASTAVIHGNTYLPCTWNEIGVM